MTTAQVVETSVTVNNNRPIQDYVHPDDQTLPTFENSLEWNLRFKLYIEESNENQFLFSSMLENILIVYLLLEYVKCFKILLLSCF